MVYTCIVHCEDAGSENCQLGSLEGEGGGGAGEEGGAGGRAGGRDQVTVAVHHTPAPPFTTQAQARTLHIRMVNSLEIFTRRFKSPTAERTEYLKSSVKTSQPVALTAYK